MAASSKRRFAILLAAVAVVAVVLLLAAVVGGLQLASTTAPQATTPVAADDAAAAAFRQQASDVQMSGSGVVDRLLADDNDGSRHQRFILKLASGQTLLIAHNIDIAPRVTGLAEGDPVEFYGVYEYNADGGVIHWTHHDPDGKHVSGWLKHDGQTYQ
jgi:hypothetical protein